MTRPLRVHLVHQGFGDYVEGLLDGLDSLGPAVEVSVTTMTSGSAALSALRDGRDRHRSLTLPRFRDPRSAVAAWSAVRDVLAQPCDVVHWQAAGNPWVDLAFYRWLRSGRRLSPAVATVHDMQAHPGDSSVLPGTFPIIERLVRRAERVIVHAAHVRDQAISVGADPARVAILPHGELATRYLPADRLPLAPSSEPTVLFFGRAQWYKGLDRAIEAMETVVERVDGARLVVAGSGPSIDQVLSPDEPVPSWCEVHRGRVPGEQVVELFGRAAVIALPYREASQSGVAALAAGFGRPVVASRLPGLTDIIDDGVTGMLVEPGRIGDLADALERLLTDSGLAARLARGAHRRATTDLSWAVIAEDLVGLYHEAVSFGVDGGRARGGDTRPRWGARR